MARLKGISKFRKTVGTRFATRFDATKKPDQWGLAHGVVTELVRDDLQNLIACKVLLDEGITLTLKPSQLIKES